MDSDMDLDDMLLEAELSLMRINFVTKILFSEKNKEEKIKRRQDRIMRKIKRLERKLKLL